MRRVLRQRRLDRLRRQFRDAIQAVSSALEAGYSAENAWKEAWQEMVCIYGRNALISREFEGMVRSISLNEPLEKVLQDFSDRTGLPEAESFTQVFCLAKRSSGDLVSIIESTVETISEKLSVQEEIMTLTADKQLEETIMSVIPAGIILYLDFAFQGFLDILYTTLMGRAVMTGCLIVYAAAVILGQSMVSAEKW